MSSANKENNQQSFHKIWLKAAGIRAVKTMAQAFAACIPTTVLSLGEVNWSLAFSAAILAGILSICTSVAGLPEVEVYNNNVGQ